MPAAEQLEDIEVPEENSVGHMLATVNPKAAAAIDNPPAPPDVGTWVVFKARAGFQRMHRTEFAALVLGTSAEDGSLTLMVVMEPEDMLMEHRVPFQSHNQDHFCWRFRRKSDAEIEAESSEIVTRLKAVEDVLDGEDHLGEAFNDVTKRLTAVEAVLMSDEIERLEARIAKLETKKGK